MRSRKTDYGTIVLHGLVVAGFGVVFVSGMRIATEASERTWINSFDVILPQNAWLAHMQAAVVLVAVSLACAIYVVRSGLGSDGARWFMTEAGSIPFSLEQDARVPVRTVIPGAIIACEFSADRADVRCAARRASGLWALEVARRLDTQSQYDVPLRTGVFMRVAAFDHSQIRHTRHVRPIRLEVE
jgi:hypothetical protein